MAKNAIAVEQEWIRENVGCQDQISTALGGFNLIEFTDKEKFKVQPLTLPAERLKELQSHLMLVFTGFSRIASEIAEKLVKTVSRKEKELNAIHQMVYEGIKILNGKSDITEFGKLLHEGWKVKRGLTNNITTPAIDQIYEASLKAGALGGKLLGAGGGGFLLLFAKPEIQKKIITKLDGFLHVPFQFENSGSQIVHYKPEN